MYAKPPFGGPQHVLHYLARYTHRVAISNHRLVAFRRRSRSPSAGRITRISSKQRLMTVTGEEFLRRFLLHVLPHGFVRIRFFGFLANRRRKSLLPLCQQLLRWLCIPALLTRFRLTLASPCSLALPALRRPHASFEELHRSADLVR